MAMMGDRKRAEEIAALRQLLEGCGADRTRWPAPDRLRFAALLKHDAQARRILAEAGALDRVLDLAPRVGEQRQRALAERIAAAAATAAQDGKAADAFGRTSAKPAVEVASERTTGGVADLAAARRRAPVRGGQFGRSRPVWHAAGLLAASLVLGVLAGGSGALAPVLQNLPGLSADADADGLHLARGLDGGLSADEDTL